jgi:predicted DNA-binding transcriptional regulator YafY
VSRAQRLLDLLQLLRCHRYPVRGAALAAELGVSLRTLYRDIATLQAQGARIEGEPGLGYVLRPGFTLPPLTFTDEEVEALGLGARWVAHRADERLADAARHALAKIRAVLPADRRAALEDPTLLLGPGTPVRTGDERLATIREAVRAERKLALTYHDPDARESVRTIWPFALAFFDRARVVVAWCELRGDFRHFRTDRIVALTPLDARYPRRRHALLREWREAQQIPARATDGI